MTQRFEILKDNPYRGLSGEVRDAGGFAKADAPFLEFLWANRFRAAIARDLPGTKHEKAFADEGELARSKKCTHLPCWSGK